MAAARSPSSSEKNGAGSAWHSSCDVCTATSAPRERHAGTASARMPGLTAGGSLCPRYIVTWRDCQDGDAEETAWLLVSPVWLFMLRTRGVWFRRRRRVLG